MKIVKISVSNFPPLKDIELTFEPSLNPPIFPIGGNNGGGKSRLLKLIFALFNKKRMDYWIRWQIEEIVKNGDVIAKITISDKESPLNFVFYMGNKEIVCDQDVETVKKNLYLINYDDPRDHDQIRGENYRTFEWLNISFLESDLFNNSWRYSKGQLKHFGLKHFLENKKDSIILIDEIENSFHPDWQFNLINDLASWGNNQYLLATHSFHLCEALTPAHVKIIES